MSGEILLPVIGIGVGATLVMDSWAWVLRRLFDVPSLDYGLVGRWVGHMGQGRFRHEGITRAAPVRGERLIGWTSHYLVGVVFAGLLVAAVGPGWLCRPSLAPALAFGALSVAAPFLLMQPAFGMGIAAARLPNPSRARVRSLVTHLVFGTGLFIAGRAGSVLFVVQPCSG